MKALVLEKEKGLPSYNNLPDYKGDDDEGVIVNLHYSALNRRDHWITQGLYPGIKKGVILGSDGVGEYKGSRVIINPGLEWGDDQRVQSDHFHVLGLPTNGTFASQVSVPRESIYTTPSHLSDAEAAALPLAGLTAYRVLFSRCQLQSGDNVLISGVGGGVAHFALLFAVAAGANVIVSSSSEEKIQKAIKLGAQHGVDYTDENWVANCKSLMPGGFDIIVDSAAGEGFQNFIKLSAPGARIGIYGGTRGTITSINPQVLFWRQISILGSTMGSPSDFSNMLEFVERHEIKPVIDAVFPMSEYAKAFERLAEARQFGKIVLDNAQ